MLTLLAGLMQEVKGVLRKYWVLFVSLPLVTGVLAFWLWPYDMAITAAVSTRGRIPFWWFYAGELSHYGAFERATLLFCGIIAAGGLWLRDNRWKRVVLSCLLACLFAGLPVNIIKNVAGRPRPNSEVMPPTFRGPSHWGDNDYKSFPSAHSCTAMATAGVLACAYPAIAVPVIVFECGVALSRIYVEGHYATDVLVGSAIGLWMGLAFGLPLRRRNG